MSGVERVMTKIKDLKSQMRDLTLTVKVVEKSPVVVRRNKRYATAVVEDETGRIRLNLWRGQTDQVRVGDVITIPQAFVNMRGKALQVSTWSDIELVSS